MKSRKPGGTIFINEDSSDSEEAHHAPRRCELLSPSFGSTTDISTSMSKTSLSSSISRFRDDFDELKCKMRIFGESLNLCHCIANDFQNRMTVMERRLQRLEDRHRLTTRESNYSAIIQKNQRLSNRTRQDAKVSSHYLQLTAHQQADSIKARQSSRQARSITGCIFTYHQKLQMCGTEEEMREVAGRICRNYLHGAWKSVDPADLDFKRISGGLSNFLYYVALPADPSKLGGFAHESSPDIDDARKPILSSHSLYMDEPKKVLLRIYGQVHGERAMDAIVTESVIFTLLSERRLGPRLHGVFSGGRIEEYIPARSLVTKELSEPAISMKIAEKMAAIHSMDVPLNKEPNWLWKTMAKWMKTARDERLAPNAVGKTAEEQDVIKQLKPVDFEKEIEWLKKFVSSVESPVVFCHNDLQEGNILLLEDEIPPSEDDDFVQYDSKSSKYVLTQFDDQNTSDSLTSHISDTGEPRLVLIDFEYCAYNYRGFDIANHFQEWSFDYTNPEHPFYYEYQENLPTLEQKEIFIKEYLKHYHTNLSEDKNHIHDPSIDEINQLLCEVEAFTLATHLLWCLWSIVNASKSQIPFGYWEFALCRLEHYMRLKQEIVKKDKFGFPQKRKICEVDI